MSVAVGKLTIDCPHCGTQLQVEARHAGKKAHCPKCAGEVAIPLQAAALPTQAAMDRLVEADRAEHQPSIDERLASMDATLRRLTEEAGIIRWWLVLFVLVTVVSLLVGACVRQVEFEAEMDRRALEAQQRL